MYVGDFLPWDARVSQLERAHDYLGAIEHALALYHGRGLGSGIGLPSAPDAQRRAIAARLAALEHEAAHALFAAPHTFDDAHAARPALARACAEVAIATHAFDWLFDELYTLYETHGCASVFVHEMEPFIVSGAMPTPAPAIMQRLLAHHAHARAADRIQALVLHVDPLHLDLDQTLSLCVQHRLWDAYIYVCTRTLHDYSTPLDALLQRAHAAVRGEDAPDAYAVFPFLTSAARGVQHPTHAPLDDAGRAAAAAAFRTLFAPRAHDPIPRAGADAPPALPLLLTLDAEALLDALDLAFESDMFDEPDTAHGAALTRRDVVDALLRTSHTLAASAEAFVALFVARNSAKYPQFLQLQPDEVRTLFDVLTRPASTPAPADCELGLECIFSAHAFAFDDAALAALAGAHFWRVYEYGLRKAQRFDALLRFFLTDGDGEHHTPNQLYSRVAELLSAPALRARADTLLPVLFGALGDVPDSLLGDLARVVARFYPRETPAVLHALHDAPQRQFLYLAPFFRLDEPAALPPPPAAELKRAWIALVAHFGPNTLVTHLRARAPDFFELHHVQEVARERRVYDALLWTYDRLGNTAEAMDTLDAHVAECSVALLALAAQQPDAETSGAERARAEAHDHLQSLRATVRTAAQLAVEHATQPREEVREAWYRVLRALLYYVHGLADPALGAHSAILALARDAGDELVQEALTALLTSVPSETVSFPDLFRRLVDAPDLAASVSYADMRRVLDGMLSTYQLRRDVLALGVRLNESDTARLFHELAKERALGWRVGAHPRCDACHQRVWPVASTSVTFTRRGQIFHDACWESHAQIDAAWGINQYGAAQ